MADPELPPVRTLEERLAAIERGIAGLTTARLQHDEWIATIIDVLCMPSGEARDLAIAELVRARNG